VWLSDTDSDDDDRKFAGRLFYWQFDCKHFVWSVISKLIRMFYVKISTVGFCWNYCMLGVLET